MRLAHDTAVRARRCASRASRGVHRVKWVLGHTTAVVKGRNGLDIALAHPLAIQNLPVLGMTTGTRRGWTPETLDEAERYTLL